MLTQFASTRPRHQVPQVQILAWLAEVHAEAEAASKGLDEHARAELAMRFRNLLARCAPGPDRIASRGCSTDEVVRPQWQEGAIYGVRRQPRGAGTAARGKHFADLVATYFEHTYAEEELPPRDLIHVTCTGYVSPSGAQRMVARRGWPTRVIHAYHMGCYAAMPAVRIAQGLLCAEQAADARVDLVHTELCSLHLAPTDHRLEQLVVQSLFGDGLIRYSMKSGDGPGLRVMATHEQLLPGSEESMSWTIGDHGMHMTLARDVPERVAAALRGFVAELLRRAGRDQAGAPSCVFAVHPGGPRIIDGVGEALELAATQVAESRAVLLAHGNMSSATLPHIWMRILEDVSIPAGTPVVSLAFGPGLTICGAVFEKQ
jgi:predicted naringenin-chalcone synthase